MNRENKKKMMMNVLKYGFLFLFFLYCLVISYNVFFQDTIVNYGFSYAISKGEVPYNDFNLVVPLFSPFFYSLSLIYSTNIINLYIFQAILLVFFFIVLERLLKKRAYLLLVLLCLGFPICLFAALFPGYNFILLFLIILLIYLEREKKSDYLIGFIIGLMLITKHTIGAFFFVPSLIYLFKDYKKVVKRFLGTLGPIFIFFIYLIITKSLGNFINLCFLGLFDFLEINKRIDNYWLVGVVIFSLCYLFYLIKKDPKNLVNYYGLLSGLFIYPLLDSYHLSYFLIVWLIIVLIDANFDKILIGTSKYMVMFALSLSIIWNFISFKMMEFSIYSFRNYSFRLLNKEMVSRYYRVNDYIKNSKYDVVLFGIGSENYFYKITNDLEITYFDLPNYGNYGYDSYKMMIKRFERLKDTIILIDKVALSRKEGQYYKELASYISKNYVYLDEVSGYDVYLKE